MDLLGIPLFEVLFEPDHGLFQHLNREDHRTPIDVAFKVLGGFMLLDFLEVLADYFEVSCDFGLSLGDFLGLGEDIFEEWVAF